MKILLKVFSILKSPGLLCIIILYNQVLTIYPSDFDKVLFGALYSQTMHYISTLIPKILQMVVVNSVNPRKILHFPPKVHYIKVDAVS